jgi:flagellar biosynthesis protein FlhF
MQAESMQIKSYYADTVEQAIQVAREDLGSDAVLITSRRAAPEARGRGAYEVVFGTSPRNRSDAGAEVDPDELGREIAMLRDQLASIKRALKQNTAASSAPSRTNLDRVQQELAQAGLDDGLIQKISEDIVHTGDDLISLQEGALASLRKRVQFAAPYAPRIASSSRVLVFVGPPGAGKTTTLAKVAMRECLGQRLTVRIISLETHRPAAQEKLRSLAKILGLGFTASSSMREFIEALDEFRGKDVLLIDTPGFGRQEFELADDLIRFVRQMPSKEVHLVLPASMNRNDLSLCAQRYAAFEPDYLLFTKLDESESHGAALNLAAQANKPVSYFTSGQGIPEDIEPANWATLAGTLLRRQSSAAVSAA